MSQKVLNNTQFDLVNILRRRIEAAGGFDLDEIVDGAVTEIRFKAGRDYKRLKPHILAEFDSIASQQAASNAIIKTSSE